MSHWMPFWHDERSQSVRPFSTSSTNSYWSRGRRCRNASLSSEELTVIVQTVFFSAWDSAPQKAAASTARSASFLDVGMARFSSRTTTLTAGPPPCFGSVQSYGKKLLGDHHQHAAGRVLDERLRDRAAPPARRPAFHVLVADDDQVGVDLLR